MEKLIFTAITAAVLLTACAKPDTENTAAYTFNDSLGREVQVYSCEKTVITSGSLAEVWQLAGGEIFGVTSDAFDGHSLDLPETVKSFGDVKNPSA